MLRRILVPLDGSELAEGALAYATELSERMGLEVLLVRVVLAGSTVPSGPVPADRDEVIGEADRYLAGVEARLREVGLRATRLILYGNAADEIIDAAEQHDVDIIVMSSHGRSGLGRWLSGSVAERVFRAANRPVLLVRAAAIAGVAQSRQPGARRQCHNCGRATYKVEFLAQDRCLYCGYYLRSCANCSSFDGVICVMQNPLDKEVSRPTDCPDFRFVEASPGRGRGGAPSDSGVASASE